MRINITIKLLEVIKWFIFDKLSLTLYKSKAMILSKATQQKRMVNLNMNIGVCQMEVVSRMKYSGIMLDTDSTFSYDIEYVKSKGPWQNRSSGADQGLYSS